MTAFGSISRDPSEQQRDTLRHSLERTLMVTLAFLGDVMLGRGVNEQVPHRAAESFWGDTLPVLRAADAVFCNLECAITRHTRPWERTIKVFHFRADPPAIELLRTANVRCASLANNHTLDYEVEGLLETMDLLDGAGIAHAGAGRTAAEAARPAIVNAGALRVAMIAATDNERPFAATADAPGTNYVDIGREPRDVERIQRSIEEARAGLAGAAGSLRADLVILSLHWGPNMVIAPPKEFRTFAHSAIEHGADVLFGHSAHVFQAAEVHRERLIMYDVGDFLDDYAVDKSLRNDWSFIFLVDIDDRRIARLRMLPVRLTYAQVNLARGREFQEICDRFRWRCRDFATTSRQNTEAIEIEVAPARR